MSLRRNYNRSYKDPFGSQSRDNRPVRDPFGDSPSKSTNLNLQIHEVKKELRFLEDRMFGLRRHVNELSRMMNRKETSRKRRQRPYEGNSRSLHRTEKAMGRYSVPPPNYPPLATTTEYVPKSPPYVPVSPSYSSKDQYDANNLNEIEEYDPCKSMNDSPQRYDPSNPLVGTK